MRSPRLQIAYCCCVLTCREQYLLNSPFSPVWEKRHFRVYVVWSAQMAKAKADTIACNIKVEFKVCKYVYSSMSYII